MFKQCNYSSTKKAADKIAVYCLDIIAVFTSYKEDRRRTLSSSYRASTQACAFRGKFLSMVQKIQRIYIQATCLQRLLHTRVSAFVYAALFRLEIQNEHCKT